MANVDTYRLVSPSGKCSSIIKGISLSCAALENILLSMAGAMIFCSMLITFADVVMRYVFNSPMGWVFDFVTLYLLPGVYFLGFSYALRVGSHLKVDYFKNKIPFAAAHVLLSFFGFVSFLLFFYISYIYFFEFYGSWKSGDVLAGVIPWPMWPSDLIVAVSCLIFSLRILIAVVEKVAFLRSDLT